MNKLLASLRRPWSLLFTSRVRRNRLGIYCHRRPVPGSRDPVFHPPLPNAVGAFDQLAAWFVSVLNHYHDTGIEALLRLIHSRQTRSLNRNDVLNGDLDSVSLEDGMP